MKKILALVLVVVGLLLSSFYVMGLLTEKSLKQNIVSLQNASKYKVKIVNYQRGLFNSHAIVNVEIISAAKVFEKDGKRIFTPANTYFISTALNIKHGPIIIVDSIPRFGFGYAKSHVVIPGAYLKNFDNKYRKGSKRPELDISIFVDYAAKTIIKVASPEFSLNSKNKNSKFEWRGMGSEIKVSNNLDNLSGNISLKGFSWMEDKILTVLKDAKSQFKLYKGDYDLYLGDSSVYAPQVLVTKAPIKLIELINFDIKSNSFVHDNLFNSSLQATVDKFYIDSKTYTNCTADLYVRNLDAKKLIDVNNKVKQAQNGTEGQRRQAILAILPDLPELLNKGAELEISDFNLETLEGVIKGGFRLSFAKDENKNPFFLIQKARGMGRLEISKDLLTKFLQDLYKDSEIQTNQEQKTDLASVVANHSTPDTTGLVNQEGKNVSFEKAKNKISYLMSVGAIVDDGNNYVINLQIVQGRLIINDKPFSMDMLRL